MDDRMGTFFTNLFTKIKQPSVMLSSSLSGFWTWTDTKSVVLAIIIAAAGGFVGRCMEPLANRFMKWVGLRDQPEDSETEKSDT